MNEDSILQSQFARPTGPGAGVIKYDVITALSVMALHDSTAMQVTVLRLVALVTARYNWKSDQFCVPQTDMARMWNVSDRTVKREIKRMIGAKLIRCIRPGVRGRVGAYRLDYHSLFDRSRSSWDAVGADYADRMTETAGRAPTKVLKVDFGARKMESAAPPLPQEGDLWSRVVRALAEEDPDKVQAWYAKLSLVHEGTDAVTLAAPSGFVANFVQTHLAGTIATALARDLGRTVRLQITY